MLAALWGASYLFIKVGVRGFEPATMMLIRVAVASALLAGFLAFRGELAGLRTRAPRRVPARHLQRRDSLHADRLGREARRLRHAPRSRTPASRCSSRCSAPWFLRGERVGGLRLLGLLVGFGGVAWLVGLHPAGDWWFVAGTMAIVVATFSYAIGSLYGQHLVVRTSGPVLATTAYIGAAVVLLPIGVVQAPHDWPGWKPVAAVLALTVLGTAVAQLLWFRLPRAATAARARRSSATCCPRSRSLYGSVFLDESLTLAKLGGFALILRRRGRRRARRP